MYDHQIWQADISVEFDANETNQTVAGDVITLRSRDKLKSLNCTTTVPLPAKLGKMITYLDGLLPIKLHDPLMT